MNDYKQLILDYIMDKHNKAIDIDNLSIVLGVSAEDFKDYIKAFNELDDQGLIFMSKKGLISYSPYQHIYKGTIKSFKRYYAICEILDGIDLEIDYEDLNGAYLDDIVQVYFDNQNYTGKVLKIIQRNNKVILAKYRNHSFLIDDLNFPYQIYVKKETDKYHLVNGHIVLLDIVEYKNDLLICKINSIIGHEDDAGIDVLSEIIKSGVPYEFSPKLIEQVNKTITSKQKVLETELKKRKDFSNELIVTIDGIDAKDLDDAISLKINDNGLYELGVHIADVSYYVDEDSNLDKSAYDRATSIYLCDRVIPMLPHELSNGICSLNQDEIRLTMSVIMEIDYQGNVVNYEICPSYIKSKARLDYDDINKLFDNQETRLTYSKELKQMLFLMERLSATLSAKMVKNGYIELNVNEAKFIVDYETHKIKDIQVRKQLKAEKLIENFMILANQVVASHIYYMQLPFIYRVHDKIQASKEMFLRQDLAELNLKTSTRVFTYQTIQSILKEVKDTNNEYIVNDTILRSMSKAIYSTDNIGHFGLGLDCYTHFTSPIRRYPDLLVHRFLKKYLIDNDFSDKSMYLQEACKQCSSYERRAMALERKVEDIYKAKYMANFVGQTFEGIISSVLSFGVFVMLDNTCEGLIRFASMKDTHYVSTSYYQSMLRPGSKVLVKVASVNEKLGEINFAYVAKKNYNKKGNR